MSRDITSRGTVVFFVSSIFLLTMKPEHFNKPSNLSSTSDVKAKGHLPFNCLGSWAILTSVHVCELIHFFLSIAEDPVNSLQLMFPQPFPSHNGYIIADRF